MRNPFAAASARMHRRAEHDEGGGYYAGAAGSRLFYDFIMGRLSANQQIRGSLQTLRNRARELITRNGTASRIPQLFSENVIGKDGITYSAAVTAGDGTFDARVNQELERAWYTWGEARHASVDRKLSWPEIETLLLESEVVDGEILLRQVPGFANPFGFAVDVLDPDQLDHTYEREAAPGQHAIVMGVEVDAWRAPVAYHLWSNHPSEAYGRGRVRVPADQIIHRFVRRRPGQARGVSWMAPAILDLAMHGGWREAHLIASRTASAKMGFLEHGPEAEIDEEEEADPTPLPMEAQPALIERLPKGVKFAGWDPTFPSTSFADFDSAILRSLAVCARTTYMSLSGDLSKTSYGSGRIGLLEAQAVYQWLGQREIETLCTPILEAWLPQALLSGALRLPSFDATRYRAATWHPKPQPWLAPEEDLNTRLTQRRAGLTSLTRIAAEQGRDLEEIFREIQREEALAREYGITIDLSPTTSAARPLVGTDDAPATTPPSRREAAALRLLGGL